MSLVPKWSSISYVVTLAAIIGIGYLGHASHWTFAAGGDHAQAVPIPTETNPTQASGSIAQIPNGLSSPFHLSTKLGCVESRLSR